MALNNKRNFKILTQNHWLAPSGKKRKTKRHLARIEVEAIRRGSLVITLIHNQTSLLAKNQQRKNFRFLTEIIG